jgi:cytoskeletal protein CcmA (bactofilin family)
MFSRSSNVPSSGSSAATGARHTPYSIIGGDVTVRGDIEASVDLHIDGRVEGDILCAALVQGPDSCIKGQISAKSAHIGGIVDGSISADELVIEASARITGDVSYLTISIAVGGQIDGKLTHKVTAGAGDLKLVKS